MGNQDILKIIPSLQAAGMVGHNFSYLKKKKKKVKDIFELGMYNVSGSVIIDAEGEFI